jgi:hypothetical protein
MNRLPLKKTVSNSCFADLDPNNLPAKLISCIATSEDE